jgi:exodeoxyribonuclease I
VSDHILAEPIFCLSDFYFGRPYSWLVTTIGANPDLNIEFYVYNLAIAPEELLVLSAEELAERLAWMPKPVRRLKSNACPMIMPMEDAPAICVARNLDVAELMRRAEFLRDNPEFRQRLIQSFRSTLPERQPSPHVEQQLYDGFFPREDEVLMQQFHIVPWEERLSIVAAFQDPRLRCLGRQLIHVERPDLLPCFDCSEYDRAIALRITADAAEVPWLTLPKALGEIDTMLADADAEQTAFLQEHRDHLAQYMAKALTVLQADDALRPDPSRAGRGSDRPRSVSGLMAHRLARKELIRRISAEEIHTDRGKAAARFNKPLRENDPPLQ